MDDDQWVYVYSTAEGLAHDVEPAFADDIVDAFDGSARPLLITWAEDSAHVVVADVTPHLRQLTRARGLLFPRMDDKRSSVAYSNGGRVRPERA
ncbi:hypothetical protein [Streptomyces sp. NPDC046985]|uniref:hypothetical protein n=1 Tax=Streptomyces sp. NPDC046985 TaxID=3155377 RepID=UPI0033E91190